VPLLVPLLVPLPLLAPALIVGRDLLDPSSSDDKLPALCARSIGIWGMYNLGLGRATQGSPP